MKEKYGAMFDEMRQCPILHHLQAHTQIIYTVEVMSSSIANKAISLTKCLSNEVVAY